jgi:hypothetical protein
MFSILTIPGLAGESEVIGLGLRLLLAFTAKEEQAAAADWARLGAGEIRGRGNAAEEDKKVPKRVPKAFFVFVRHNQDPSIKPADGRRVIV